MSKHTAGPWTSIRSGKGDWHILTEGVDVEDESFAIVRGEDDARLIAAAPDLLAALQEMLLQHGVRGGNGPSAQARAAIAKATGDK